jgi:hypothetical protein
MLAEREASTGRSVSLPWSRRLSLWRHGFTSRSGVLFGVGPDEYDRYLSDYQLELLGDLGGQWTGAVHNKLTSHLLFGSFDDHLPDLYGVLDAGRMRRTIPLLSEPSEPPVPRDSARPSRSLEPSDPSSPSDVSPSDPAGAAAWVRTHLDRNEAVVLKPVYGHGGRGILVCRRAPDDDGYLINDEQKTSREFSARIDDLEEYLACEFVEQADYADGLFPDSANTLRLLTLWDDDVDEPFVAGAVHRIGTRESAPVDNWSRGGLSAAVNDEGRLGPGAQWSSSTGEPRWYDTHPDTGARIEGVRVPGWPSIRERVLEMAAEFRYLPRIGWDVVVTDDGSFTVLEINAHAGVETLQVHRPHLADARVWRFYEHRGYV